MSHAGSVADVQDVVRRHARSIAHADGASFVLRDGDECVHLDEDAIEPLWKGQRFPMSACVSGWVMTHGESAVIADVYADPRVPTETYRPTFVKSLAMVPVRHTNPIAAIGVYWARTHQVSVAELEALQALANSTAVAMAHVQALADLERALHLAGTDQLTGLPNRRDFLDRVGAARRIATDAEQPCILMFFDIDGLTRVNDEHGHHAGDRLIASSAQLLRSTLRQADVLARWGGDEFVALLQDGRFPDRTVDRIAEVLRDGVDASDPLSPRLSIGSIVIAPGDQRSIEELLHAADTAMHENRTGRPRLTS